MLSCTSRERAHSFLALSPTLMLIKHGFACTATRASYVCVLLRTHGGRPGKTSPKVKSTTCNDCECTHKHTSIHTSTRAHAHTHPHTPAHTETHTCTHPHAHTPTPTATPIHMHTHSHTYTFMHTFEHTKTYCNDRLQQQLLPFSSLLNS